MQSRLGHGSCPRRSPESKRIGSRASLRAATSAALAVEPRRLPYRRPKLANDCFIAVSSSRLRLRRRFRCGSGKGTEAKRIREQSLTHQKCTAMAIQKKPRMDMAIAILTPKLKSECESSVYVYHKQVCMKNIAHSEAILPSWGSPPPSSGST